MVEHDVAELIDGGNPFGVPVKFCALDAERHGLRSPAVVGKRLYVAAKMERAASAGRLARPLEAVRLAPSAGNKQPWHVVVEGGAAHFYELHSIGENALGDVQKVDVGIALSHFDLVAREMGMSTMFAKSDPGLGVPDGAEYIMTCEVA